MSFDYRPEIEKAKAEKGYLKKFAAFILLRRRDSIALDTDVSRDHYALDVDTEKLNAEMNRRLKGAITISSDFSLPSLTPEQRGNWMTTEYNYRPSIEDAKNNPDYGAIFSGFSIHRRPDALVIESSGKIDIYPLDVDTGKLNDELNRKLNKVLIVL